MALGADRVDVSMMVMRRVVALVSVGLLGGIALSAWASRFVGALLFNLEPRDPRTFLTAATVLIAVGALAAWLPASRAHGSDAGVAESLIHSNPEPRTPNLEPRV